MGSIVTLLITAKEPPSRTDSHTQVPEGQSLRESKLQIPASSQSQANDKKHWILVKELKLPYWGSIVNNTVPCDDHFV